MSANLAPPLDARQIRRAFSRFRAADPPTTIAAERLWQRVESMAQTPAVAIEAGGDGHTLAAHYPRARVLALDFALPALSPAPPEPSSARRHPICADATRMPLPPACADLHWSAFCVDWTDYHDFFSEAARVLRPDGLLAFAALGPDTLQEMRQVFAGEARVHTFADMHDLGDALMRTGFAEPIMECERLTLTYASPEDALTEARQLGAGNAYATRPPMGKNRWQHALRDYRRIAATADDPDSANDTPRVRATYEVIYATAWRRADAAATGESPIQFAPRWRK